MKLRCAVGRVNGTHGSAIVTLCILIGDCRGGGTHGGLLLLLLLRGMLLVMLSVAGFDLQVLPCIPEADVRVHLQQQDGF